MNKNDYLKLPDNLRKQIFQFYNSSNNENKSPDFNRGQLHILEELFGWENCSVYISDNNIQFEISGIANHLNKNNSINFIPDTSIEDAIKTENAIKELIKEAPHKINIIINLTPINNECK